MQLAGSVSFRSLLPMDLDPILTFIETLPASCIDVVRKHFHDTKVSIISKQPLHAQCFDHGHTIIGFCEDCKQPFCSRCKGCAARHSIKTLDEIVKVEFLEQPTCEQVCQIAAIATERIPGARTASDEAARVMREVELEAKARAEFMNDTNAVCERDVGELARMRSELIAARGRVDTDTAKAAFAAAREQLDVDLQVSAELTRYAHAHLQAKIKLASARTTAARLRGELARLEFTSTLTHFPSSPQDQAALALIAHTTNVVLSKEFGTAREIRHFYAFEDVQHVPEVAAAYAKPLSTVGAIQVGEPVEMPWIPHWPNDYMGVTLSPCGVLCVGGDVRNLLVFHMRTRKTVTLNGRGAIYGFVYENMLYVAQQNVMYLCYAPVAEVLAGRTFLDTFDKLQIVAPWGYVPCLDTAPRGWVATLNPQDRTQIVFIDLCNKKSRLINAGSGMYYLGGLTGIDIPGVLCIAGNNTKSAAVFAVAPDGSKRIIAYGMGIRPTVLPSATDPADLARAAVFDITAAFSVCEEKTRLHTPIKPARDQLFVRLYRDVFLCADQTTKTWFSLRVVIP
eukprot:gnl/Chilomastix_cuspidata/3984.p1 GENE.gnl/Chilomastix_cuspidata/3984~~gnl/Chilomastix_cuspidata/3984.p1  ORF type:complete len:566 (+),score=53.11 gnl/Chilomastix_cuspidata/3984:1-1698(+)